MIFINDNKIKTFIYNGIKLKKVLYTSNTLPIVDLNVFKTATPIFQGSSSLINGSWYSDSDEGYIAYNSSIHTSRSFSMPEIRWDNTCSHGTWCDSTPVASFYYPSEYGPNFLKVSNPTVACDGCHWGSGLVTPRSAPGTNGVPSDATVLVDIQVDYSYFTFARTLYYVL